MPYATAAALRTRYRRGDLDEFAAVADADLDQALTAASDEIDTWRPAGELGTAALAVLAGQCLPLARLHVYGDSALDPSHPIVREALAVRAWLKALAAGQVCLPSEPDGTAATATQTPQVSAPAEVFGADFLRRYAG